MAISGRRVCGNPVLTDALHSVQITTKIKGNLVMQALSIRPSLPWLGAFVNAKRC